MYLPNFNKSEPFPLALPQATPGAGASDDSTGLQLPDAAMLAFNFQLQGVHQQAPSVGTAQIIELARWLKALPAEAAEATISLRMARAESLRRMLDDADWTLPEATARRGRRLLEYIQQLDDLIPDDVPLLGHLDDALLVELSWEREFAGEVQDYLDFCRFCGEGRHRGSAAELRTSWERECLAQASAMLHRQEIDRRGYARPRPLSRPFRVH